MDAVIHHTYRRLVNGSECGQHLFMSLVSDDQSFLTVNPYILLSLVSFGLFNLLFTLTKWFWYIFAVSPRSQAERRKNDLCTLYAVSSTIFILGDWLIFYAPQPIDPDWSNVGANYLTLCTYLVAFCTAMVTVITTRNTWEDSLNTKVHHIHNKRIHYLKVFLFFIIGSKY